MSIKRIAAGLTLKYMKSWNRHPVIQQLLTEQDITASLWLSPNHDFIARYMPSKTDIQLHSCHPITGETGSILEQPERPPLCQPKPELDSLNLP
jgi:hypothetical protein